MLGVSKSSVSLWVRDVDFVPRDPAYGRWRPGRKPSSLSLRKQAEIERLLARPIARSLTRPFADRSIRWAARK